ncbi:hypothetical protein [Brevibacillus borstelensis]|uniref:hypothetical protein n=1 Tax=Brevibacillus borstelensis TaxID=45462 RepID=UPI0004F2C5C0|nr:hypothetical protein [Brevibacillus borstelensis]
MTGKTKIHESQPAGNPPIADQPVNPLLEQAQVAEGGGPPKPVDMRSMPRWLRFFGYSFLAAFFLLVLLLLVSSVLT